MRYVHIFDGTEIDAPEGARNWPWVSAEAQHIGDRTERAREAARGMVADALEGAKSKSGKPGPKPKAAAEPEDAGDA